MVCMRLCISWLLFKCNLYAPSVYSSFMVYVPYMWVIVFVYMGATFLLNVYCVLHIPWALHECCMHLLLFHSLHNVCYLQLACIFHVACTCYVLHVSSMPTHHVCCVCVCGVYVFMFWLQTAPPKFPVCKWPSRPWMRMTMLPSWLSPTTPLCVILQPLAS